MHHCPSVPLYSLSFVHSHYGFQASIDPIWFVMLCTSSWFHYVQLFVFILSFKHFYQMVTGYYKHSSADKLDELLDRPEFSEFNTLETRFQLCIDYVKILQFLHNSPLGIRVMCDSNDIVKTLSQYLITDDFHLVVNDLDALPEVKPDEGELIKCGHRELFGDFVAPEQLWSYGDSHPFNEEEMPSYDEMIDMWRIPNVVDKLLGRVHNSNYVRRLLLGIHESCKQENPQERPTATEVLEVFLNVQKIIRAGIRKDL